MSYLRIEGLSKQYGAISALHDVDLAVQKGELLTILGPSGCGKTTLLRLVAGFATPSRGRILVDDADLTPIAPNRRDIGMVFQNYALFPHLTVARNIAFGLEERGLSRARVRDRVVDLLALVRLSEVGNHLPAELSGGQQQRVALARAIAYSPKVLLMDEPLGALDLKLREIMQLEIRGIQRALGITALYVTHDQTEAMRISDRIAIMNVGRIEQLGTPTQIYAAPATRFVAEFVGRINLLPAWLAHVDGEGMVVRLAIGELCLPKLNGMTEGMRVTLGIRPDEIKIGPLTSEHSVSTRGTIVERAFLGSVIELRLRLADGSALLVEARPDAHVGEVGEEIVLGWGGADCKVFPE